METSSEASPTEMEKEGPIIDGLSAEDLIERLRKSERKNKAKNRVRKRLKNFDRQDLVLLAKFLDIDWTEEEDMFEVIPEVLIKKAEEEAPKSWNCVCM